MLLISPVAQRLFRQNAVVLQLDDSRPGVKPHLQLVVLERFGYVIVRTCFHSGDEVLITLLGREHLLEIVETLEKKGVAFRVPNINLDTSSLTGKLMLTMLDAIATFEREMMLERQLEGISLRREFDREPTTHCCSVPWLSLLNSLQELFEKLQSGLKLGPLERGTLDHIREHP